MSDAIGKYLAKGIRCGVLDDIYAERERQLDVEGWTPEHDDEHDAGEMAKAAAVYAYTSTLSEFQAEGWRERLRGPLTEVSIEGDKTIVSPGIIRVLWPWAPEWFKPNGKRRDLIKAAALLVAEIERIDRAKARSGEPGKTEGEGEKAGSELKQNPALDRAAKPGAAS